MQKSANVLGAEDHALKQTSISFRAWISVFCKKLWYQFWQMLLTSLLRLFLLIFPWSPLEGVRSPSLYFRPFYLPVAPIIHPSVSDAELNDSLLHSFHFTRNCWSSTRLIGYQPKTPCGISTSPTSVRRFAPKPTKTDMKTFRCPLTFALSHILHV